jgi:Zn finger protein HypA/HybF involved in hydrogenase expression
MKILIKSIKPNDNYGGSRTFEAGPISVKFVCRGELPDYFRDNPTIWIESYQDTGNEKIYEGRVNGPIEIEKLKADNIQFTITREEIETTMLHEPENFVEYEDQVVECRSCNAKFNHYDLESDSNEWGGYSDKVCPECEGWDCCDIEYEMLNEYKERTKSE